MTGARGRIEQGAASNWQGVVTLSTARASRRKGSPTALLVFGYSKGSKSALVSTERVRTSTSVRGLPDEHSGRSRRPPPSAHPRARRGHRTRRSPVLPSFGAFWVPFWAVSSGSRLHARPVRARTQTRVPWGNGGVIHDRFEDISTPRLVARGRSLSRRTSGRLCPPTSITDRASGGPRPWLRETPIHAQLASPGYRSSAGDGHPFFRRRPGNPGCEPPREAVTASVQRASAKANNANPCPGRCLGQSAQQGGPAAARMDIAHPKDRRNTPPRGIVARSVWHP